MAKERKEGRGKINGARAVKIGGLVFFAGFAGMLALAGMFAWRSLDDLGMSPESTSDDVIQGLNEDLLDDVERRISERISAPSQDDSPIRNPFLPPGQQRPSAPEPTAERQAADVPVPEVPPAGEPAPDSASEIPAEAQPGEPTFGSPATTQ